MSDKPVQCEWAEYGESCKNPLIHEQYQSPTNYIRCPFIGYCFQDKIGCFCQHFIHKRPVRYDVVAGDIVVKSYSTNDDYDAKSQAEYCAEHLKNIHIEVHDDGM